ncbi:MAG: hypothetical protein ACRDI2_07235 [Chloroflexota bacterium]
MIGLDDAGGVVAGECNVTRWAEQTHAHLLTPADLLAPLSQGTLS